MWLASLGDFWSTVQVIKPWRLCNDTHSLGCQSLPSFNTKRLMKCYVHKQIIWYQGNFQVAVIRRAFAATFFQRRRRRSSRAAAVHADGQASFAQAVSGVRQQHLKPLDSYIIKHWFHIRVMAQISHSKLTVQEGVMAHIWHFIMCTECLSGFGTPNISELKGGVWLWLKDGYLKMISLWIFGEHHCRCLQKVCYELRFYVGVFWPQSKNWEFWHHVNIWYTLLDVKSGPSLPTKPWVWDLCLHCLKEYSLASITSNHNTEPMLTNHRVASSFNILFL